MSDEQGALEEAEPVAEAPAEDAEASTSDEPVEAPEEAEATSDDDSADR